MGSVTKETKQEMVSRFANKYISNRVITRVSKEY